MPSYSFDTPDGFIDLDQGWWRRTVIRMGGRKVVDSREPFWGLISEHGFDAPATSPGDGGARYQVRHGYWIGTTVRRNGEVVAASDPRIRRLLLAFGLSFVVLPGVLEILGWAATQLIELGGGTPPIMPFDTTLAEFSEVVGKLGSVVIALPVSRALRRRLEGAGE